VTEADASMDHVGPEAVRDRAELNRRTRDVLAERLAVNAEQLAGTLERAADLHDAMAADETHPLHEGSAQRAAAERSFAASERQAAARWRPAAARATGATTDRPTRA